jgi:hypothetical protein
MDYKIDSLRAISLATGAATIGRIAATTSARIGKTATTTSMTGTTTGITDVGMAMRGGGGTCGTTTRL